MIKLAFFLVKYLFSNKYRVIIAFSSKIDYLCFRVIQLCEVWGIRLIDFRNQFVTHPFLSLILQFVNQRDSLNGNNLIYIVSVYSVEFSILGNHRLYLSCHILYIMGSCPCQGIRSVLLPLLLYSVGQISDFRVLPCSIDSR